MEKLMTGAELADKAIDCATNYKTLYVNGCWGTPLTEANKQRFLKNPKNARADRQAKIEAASADTFGFDCVCLVKSLSGWGWSGDANHHYGGVDFGSNGVPDVGEDGVLNLCEDVSDNFATVQAGEYLYMDDHCGIYVGNGMAVEAVSRWQDGVQLTRIWNMLSNDGTPGRYWEKHGKLPWIAYESEPVFRVTIENVPKSRAAELVREGAEKGWAVNVEAMEVAEVAPEAPAEPAPVPEKQPDEVKVEYAKERTNALAGSYRVNVQENLNIRAGAGLDKPIIGKLKAGDIVKCYGFHTDAWLCVVTETGMKGYCHQGYLDKM